MFTDNFKMTG